MPFAMRTNRGRLGNCYYIDVHGTTLWSMRLQSRIMYIMLLQWGGMCRRGAAPCRSLSEWIVETERLSVGLVQLRISLVQYSDAGV